MAGSRRAVLTPEAGVTDPEGESLSYTLQTLSQGQFFLGDTAVAISQSLTEAESQALVYEAPETADVYTATFAVSDGRNTVPLNVALTVSAGVNATLIGTANADVLDGAAGNDSLEGYDGDDALYGGSGNDTLRGGGGADTLEGGAGRDVATYYNASVAVRVDLAAGLGQGGTAEGDVLAGIENLRGGGGDDTLIGNADDNTLNGGLGADQMEGGAGDDTYVIDNVGDQVIETTAGGLDAGGLDLVQTTVSYALSSAGAAFVERVQLLGSAAIDAVGNAQDNRLTGNAGANRLDGGLGADIMLGGAGDDVYIVDNTADQIFETTTTASSVDAGGLDRIESSVTFSLSTTVGKRFIEDLVLTGTAKLNGYGNALDNRLTGNAGANRLNGGVGADTMAGGAGNDTYEVDDAGDVVIETDAFGLDSGGIDLVRSAVSFSLDASAGVGFVERLVLTGSADIDGTGNSQANVIQGNAGANALRGGLGIDTLTGGAGADSFVFDTAPGSTHSDRITDFVAGEDAIGLDAAMFAGLSIGALDAALFAANASGLATDAAHRVIYNTTTGALWYDADGTGSDAALKIADLTNLASLTQDDVFVF